MKQFKLKARDQNGKQVIQTRQALSADHLRRAAQSEGLFVTDLKPLRSLTPDFNRWRGVKPAAILAMLRELRTIVGAGIPVTEALTMVQNRPADPALTSALHDVNADVRRGKPLADAFAERSDIFEPGLSTTFQIGMSSGGLLAALERYETDLKLRLDLAAKFRKAMTYPLFLLGLLGVVLVVLFTFILPNFVDLYAEFGAELPTATRWLIAAVNSAPIWGGAIVTLIAAIWAGRKALRATVSGALWLDKLALRVPVFGKMRTDALMAQTASSLSLLLYSGMPLKAAIGLLRDTCTNNDLAKRLTAVETGLTTGQKFSELAQANGIFSGTGIGMIHAGERTGALDQMTGHVAKLHEQQLGDRVDVVTALIEPVMMVLVGGVIGVIVITVYLPIFGVTNVIE